ncbi:hypothetical protein [Streptomyces sp. NPDC058157]|uniref:hypothetical protein n=1 Tax=Streptomyces sp. NPDC058157 TaxID=3346360 RepID=UPI0036EF09BA
MAIASVVNPSSQQAELLGLRVLVTGWQTQPQRLMADIAGIPGPGMATGERYTLPGFRRLIRERALRTLVPPDPDDGWHPCG